MNQIECLLLSGSPRGKKSTSYVTLEYLQRQLEERGHLSELFVLSNASKDEAILKRIRASIISANHVVLAAPLYVDSLPSHVIEFLEKIVSGRNSMSLQNTPKFTAIINSGFPEASQNILALEICKQFSREAQFEWMGGLPFGGGAAIDGTPLELSGFRGRHVRPAIELLADAISNNEVVPESAIELMNKPVIPKRLYIMASQSRWKRIAKRNNVDDLSLQPYMNE